MNPENLSPLEQCLWKIRKGGYEAWIEDGKLCMSHKILSQEDLRCVRNEYEQVLIGHDLIPDPNKVTPEDGTQMKMKF